MKKFLAVILSVLMLSALLVSCGKKEVLVTLNGGTLDSTYIENAEFDDLIATVPTRDGYVFAGWYGDAAYTDYINPGAITETQKENGRAFAKWITVPESTSYNVRSDAATITDSGRANQKMDIVSISEQYNVNDLIRAGYTSLNVKVKLTVCEVDDGYQYVFLYKNEQCIKPATSSLIGIVDKYILGEDEDDPSLVYTYKFEHDPSMSNHTWETYEFETTVSLSSLEKELYLRYGASGNGDDTWQNKDILVTVSPVK